MCLKRDSNKTKCKKKDMKNSPHFLFTSITVLVCREKFGKFLKYLFINQKIQIIADLLPMRNDPL